MYIYICMYPHITIYCLMSMYVCICHNNRYLHMHAQPSALAEAMGWLREKTVHTQGHVNNVRMLICSRMYSYILHTYICCMCVYACFFKYIIYVYIYIYIYKLHLFMNAYMHPQTHTHTYIHVYIYIGISMCKY